jgi:hypothetical protein
MIELAVGPVLALLISLKFTQQIQEKQDKQYKELAETVSMIVTKSELSDKETLQKIMQTVMPIAKAVNKLNQEVGL